MSASATLPPSADSNPGADGRSTEARSHRSHRKFAADATSMAVFWTVVYAPVFLLTSRSLDAALFGLGSAAVLEILLGGVYGRFSDWFRSALRVE